MQQQSQPQQQQRPQQPVHRHLHRRHRQERRRLILCQIYLINQLIEIKLHRTLVKISRKSNQTQI
jgi:hypothetical protein